MTSRVLFISVCIAPAVVSWIFLFLYWHLAKDAPVTPKNQRMSVSEEIFRRLGVLKVGILLLTALMVLITSGLSEKVIYILYGLLETIIALALLRLILRQWLGLITRIPWGLLPPPLYPTEIMKESKPR